MPKSNPKQTHRAILAGLGAVTTLILAAVFFAVMTLGQLVSYAQTELATFLTAAQTNPGELITLGVVGWHSTPVQTDGKKNILILGLDSLSTRGDAPALTDTIMIVSLDLKTGQAKAVSLPRDIYVQSLQTRINSLYWYGTQQSPDNPVELPTTTISELTGVPIHHTMVVSLEEIGQLIDLLGGVTIDVPVGFVDELFPRTDVDVTVERDPAKLYETVEFTAGTHVFDGQTALKYIRSRHGEGTEGNDLARARRQQQVITSLLKSLTNTSLYRDPNTAGQMVAFYRQHFAQSFPTTELVATLRQLLPVKNNITFSGSSVSVYPDEVDGVLYHPPLSAYGGQWLYVIRDETAFRNEIQQQL